MHCPLCGDEDTRVIASRLVGNGEQLRRWCACQSCAERFSTYETAQVAMPRIFRSNGAREPFGEERLRREGAAAP